MKLKNLGLVIRREYLNKVQKKSFLLITFITPILFAALCILPTVIMMNTKEDASKVAVIDESGIVFSQLESNDLLEYHDFCGASADSLKLNLSSVGMDVLLHISPIDPDTRSFIASTYSEKPLGIDSGTVISSSLSDILENWRIQSYGIENLAEILGEVKADVNLQSYTIDEKGNETITESSIYMAVSLLLGMGLYMFIALFSSMVMSSVIEEKSSRVVEVLVSSVRATELMFGKIIGVALVALTQFLLWIVLTIGIVGVAGSFIGGSDMTEGLSAMTEMTTDPSMGEALSNVADADNPMETIISTLSTLNVGQIALSFLFYFLFGYLLYASLFAAIGSSVENEGDSQQLQLPVTVPLLLAMFVALYAFKAPDSGIVFWCSMIPFTSPTVMLARLPFGVPFWELALSIGLLIVTFALCAWLSAKIYKIGILMYGKKTGFKDLWKWLKQK